MTPSPVTLHVEGWRTISHSYALVNQFQCLHWLKSGACSLIHTDWPFLLSHWGKASNPAGFSDEDTRLLEALPTAGTPNALYRIYAPFGLDVAVTMPTMTFAVTELGFDDSKVDASAVQAYAQAGGKIHTPSHWSKARLVASGLPEDIICVIPHASDPAYFFVAPEEAAAQARRDFGFGDDDVVLLNVGTHHWNKGLDVLIKAFALARLKNRRLKLVLKDQQSTYGMSSESYVFQTLRDLKLTDDDLVSAIHVISGHLNLRQLNTLYNIADAYVTPYRAEGFNLPALEAQACGTPVIATRGGATDDFLRPEGNHFITGKLIENSPLGGELQRNAYIEPALDQLIAVLFDLQRKPRATLTTPSLPDWTAVGRQILAQLN